MGEETIASIPVRVAPDVSEAIATSVKSAPTGVRLTVMTGFAIIAVFFGGLGVWAVVAPLESAAIAAGTVIVDTNRKTIQHLEGGIVSEILVRDGDKITPGQVLIRLDETRPRSTLDLLQGRRLAASALEARLAAERDGRAEIIFPRNLLDRLSDPNLVKISDGQVNIFKARRKALSGQVAIHGQRIAQIAEEIKGLKGQIKAENDQLELINDEIRDVSHLVEKGYARKTRLRALQRRLSEIKGSRAHNRAQIARAKQSIGESNIRIADLRTGMLNDVVVQLREVQSELFDLAERIRAAEDVLRRTEIRAPQAGTVVGLQVHTVGGVIGPGTPLLDIVPSGDRLVIEAHVDPMDIDVVHPGLTAQVRITAFNARNIEPLKGRVMSVSADRLIDEHSGQPYYLIRVEITRDPAKVMDRATLYPGMSAEVMIVTGTRTALEYIVKPITTGLNRAFREQ